MRYEIVLLDEEILKEYKFSLKKDLRDLKINQNKFISLIEDSDLIFETHKRPKTLSPGKRTFLKKFNLSDGNRGGSKSLRVIALLDIKTHIMYIVHVYRKKGYKDQISAKQYEMIKVLRKDYESFID